MPYVMQHSTALPRAHTLAAVQQRTIGAQTRPDADPQSDMVRPRPENATGKRLFWTQDQFCIRPF